MTKAKVIRAFTCINTRKHYALGSIYEADTARINQLASKGYVKAEPLAYIPKAEVPAPSKAEVSQPTKPKKKRNEPK